MWQRLGELELHVDCSTWKMKTKKGKSKKQLRSNKATKKATRARARPDFPLCCDVLGARVWDLISKTQKIKKYKWCLFSDKRAAKTRGKKKTNLHFFIVLGMGDFVSYIWSVPLLSCIERTCKVKQSLQLREPVKKKTVNDRKREWMGGVLDKCKKLTSHSKAGIQDSQKE